MIGVLVLNYAGHAARLWLILDIVQRPSTWRIIALPLTTWDLLSIHVDSGQDITISDACKASNRQ